jgi:hypothetical protein
MRSLGDGGNDDALGERGGWTGERREGEVRRPWARAGGQPSAQGLRTGGPATLLQTTQRGL